MKDTKETGTAGGAKTETFSADERAAMKERAKEMKASARKADGEADVRAKIAEMPDADRVIAERLHELITSIAPDLAPKTWYGMPAYTRDGKVVCFFQAASKFKARYATLGFDESANLDDGTMWPTSYALTELNSTSEARITELVRRAIS